MALQPLGPPPATRPSGSTARRAAATLAAVAVLGASVLGAQRLAGDGRGDTGEPETGQVADPDGDGPGADTPEAAVDRLLTALTAEDVLGTLEALPAGERDAWRHLIDQSKAELQRVGVVTDAADLGRLDGIEFDLSGYTLHSTVLGGRVARVDVDGGRYHLAYDADRLPLGDATLEALFDGRPPRAGSRNGAVPDDIVITAVRDADGWHASLLYTLAHRMQGDHPDPSFGESLPAEGSSSPEEAVTKLLDATEQLDARRVLALTAPGEAAVLHDYAPLLLPDMEAGIAAWRDDYEVSFDLRPGPISVRGDGARRIVTVEQITVDARSNGEGVLISYDGDCTERTERSLDEGDQDGSERGEQSRRSCRSDRVAHLAGPGAELAARTSRQPLELAVVEEQGQWYLSPLGSLAEPPLGLLRALDADLALWLIDSGLAGTGESTAGAGEVITGPLWMELYVSVSVVFSYRSVPPVDPAPTTTWPPVTTRPGSTGTSLIPTPTTAPIMASTTVVPTSMPPGMTAPASSPEQALRNDFDATCRPVWLPIHQAKTADAYYAQVLAAHECTLPFVAAGIEPWAFGWDVANPECVTAWPWDPSLSPQRQARIFLDLEVCAAAKHPEYQAQLDAATDAQEADGGS